MRRWLCECQNKADFPKTDETEKNRLREKYKDCFLEIKVYSTGANDFSHTFLVPMAERPLSKFLQHGVEFSFEALLGCLSYELGDWRTEVTLLDLTRGMVAEVATLAEYMSFDDGEEESWSLRGGRWPYPPYAQHNTCHLFEPQIYDFDGGPTRVDGGDGERSGRRG